MISDCKVTVTDLMLTILTTLKEFWYLCPHYYNANTIVNKLFHTSILFNYTLLLFHYAGTRLGVGSFS